MLIRLFGSETVSISEARNACLPIVLTPSGIVTSVIALHPQNASSPIVVTLEGITGLCNAVQK